jgi:hypothetical protein
MVRQKVRQLPAANATPNVNELASQQHQNLMMANMMSECPGCAHNHPAYPTPNDMHDIQYQDVPGISTNNAMTPVPPASLKRKGAAVKVKFEGNCFRIFDKLKELREI